MENIDFTQRPSDNVDKDSYPYTNRNDMKTEEAQKIAGETRRSYDEAAAEFSASRARFWDELAYLGEHINTGDRVLDIGCGNGRFFPLVEKSGGKYTGIDYSEGLIGEARRLHPEGDFIEADATALPFKDDAFDIVYSFATIHHIPGDEMRTQFVAEAARVLRSGGLLVLTTWNLWTPRHIGVLLANFAKNILWWRSPSDLQDVVLALGKSRLPRYIHAFTKGELTALLAKNGFTVLSVDTIPRPSGEKNIVVLAKRTSKMVQ